MTTPAAETQRFRLRGLELWERNLYILWVAQATASIGFSFFFPFVPLFIQELGVEDPRQAAFWSGVAGGVGGFFMMLSGPVWGVLGDRYGRKKNVLRSLFGSAVILGVTGLVTDVYQLVAFRVLLGLVSGTWVTVMALASSMAPRHRVTFSIGVVQSASFLGFTTGPFIGGVLADSLGFRTTFFITGLLCLSSGLLVLFLVKEAFQRPENQERLGFHLVFSGFANIVRSRDMAPVLLVLFLVQIVPTMMMPVLPVLIGTLINSGSAASSAGVAFSISGLMGTVSSLLMSRLTQRIGLVPVYVGAMAGASVTYIPLFFVSEVTHIYGLIALLGLFNGGLNTLSFAMVGSSASADKQGAAYGVAQSASSLAWGLGPLTGGAISGLWGLREVFLVNSVSLFITGALIVRLMGQRRQEAQPAEPAPQAQSTPRS